MKFLLSLLLITAGYVSAEVSSVTQTSKPDLNQNINQDLSAASDPANIEKALNEIDAKIAENKAKQSDIEAKLKQVRADEAKHREEILAANKALFEVSDIHGNFGKDEEVAAIRNKIDELEEQIKELREKLQQKLEKNPEFVRNKIKVQDSAEKTKELLARKNELMAEKAKLNSEMRQLERTRLSILEMKEKQTKSEAKQ